MEFASWSEEKLCWSSSVNSGWKPILAPPLTANLTCCTRVVYSKPRLLYWLHIDPKSYQLSRVDQLSCCWAVHVFPKLLEYIPNVIPTTGFVVPGSGRLALRTLLKRFSGLQVKGHSVIRKLHPSIVCAFSPWLRHSHCDRTTSDLQKSSCNIYVIQTISNSSDS